MNLIRTWDDPDFKKDLYGIEIKGGGGHSSDLCYCCPRRPDVAYTLWRGNHGSSISFCDHCKDIFTRVMMTGRDRAEPAQTDGVY